MARSVKRKLRQRRKHTKQRNSLSNEIDTKKKELGVLVDSIRSQREKNSSLVDFGRVSETSDSLDSQFSNVFARFKFVENSIQGEERKVTVLSQASDTHLETEKHIEKNLKDSKKLKCKKPSLAYLKSISAHPELIQWYDCDANDPLFLVSIKSSKNIVPVPSHWNTKRDYLSGRSLLEKKPFELPDVIKQTNIEDMRNTMQSAETDKSLKQDSRARVRPQLGKLDLDYGKLHDAFFKLGRKWRPELMLSYGDQYYENRNLHQEICWTRMRSKYKPGKLSSALRKALGFHQDRLPIWCKKWKEIGLPPSYPGMKVAGINWDMTNLRDDTYGEWSPGPVKDDIKLFGCLVSFESSFVANNESKTNNSEHIQSENQLETEAKSLESTAIVHNHEKTLQPDTSINTNIPKPLYTVLDGPNHQSHIYTTSKDENSIANTLNSQKISNIKFQTSQSPDHVNTENDTVERFKF